MRKQESVHRPMTTTALCIHAHFYQPPREDPWTGTVPQEVGAEPYHDYNAKITAECYRPNLESGNFDRISFNIGPTLAIWMEIHAPDVYAGIIAADHAHHNAIAQVYNHTILPLASREEKMLQIAWGIADFRRRFDRHPTGMWLAETAVDIPTLSALATAGIAYTVLAPWQAAGTTPWQTAQIDTNQPYWVELPDNKRIGVFFFNANLAGMLHRTRDISAQTIARALVPMCFDNQWMGHQRDQIVVAATDGEFYGHHIPGHAELLRDLTATEMSNTGYQLVSLNEWFAEHPPTATIQIREHTAWSCAHHLNRWKCDCDCARENDHPEANGTWKTGLRTALDHLAERIDGIYMAMTLRWLRNPAEAKIASIEAITGTLDWEQFFIEQGTNELIAMPISLQTIQYEQLKNLLTGQYYRQLMYTSCGFFFEDLDRIEPINTIRSAARAIQMTEQGAPLFALLVDDFAMDLAYVVSARTGVTGAEIFYRAMDRGVVTDDD